jgi:hypothetical protein
MSLDLINGSPSDRAPGHETFTIPWHRTRGRYRMNDLGIVNRPTARRRRSVQGNGGDGQGVQAEVGALNGVDRLAG